MLEVITGIVKYYFLKVSFTPPHSTSYLYVSLIFSQSLLLQPSYWCSSPRMALVNEKEEEEDAEKALKGEFIEEEPAGLVSGIKIKHLAKVSSKTDAMTQRVSGSTYCKMVQMLKFLKKCVDGH